MDAKAERDIRREEKAWRRANCHTFLPKKKRFKQHQKNRPASTKIPFPNFYAERAKVVLELGFKNYKAYRASDLWKRIREAVFTRDKGICKMCGVRDATQVHHLNYAKETLDGTNLEGAVASCAGCHIKVEFKDGKKRSYYGAQQSACMRIVKVTEQQFYDPIDAAFDAAIRE